MERHGTAQVKHQISYLFAQILQREGMENSTSSAQERKENPIDREGYVWKRGAKLQRWSLRFLILRGSEIAYKLKEDSPIRDSYDLQPGCLVTDIIERDKKHYIFWLVWPRDKNVKAEDDNNNKIEDDQHKQNENIDKKDLKKIVKNEAMQQKKQQDAVEEQLERHQIHDKNVSFYAKVGAVAAGGIVVGALTAGIGLVPYIIGVGVIAVAGGGAVAIGYKRPEDSRLVLSCDSMAEAVSWKHAIEEQIAKLELKTTLPASADPKVISHIISLTALGRGAWRRFCVCEGVRLLEQTAPENQTRCMKAQLVLKATPFVAFQALMEQHCWPKRGNAKVVRTVDDHVDIVGYEVISDCSARRGPVSARRRIYLSRFWRLDDDGVYLIALSSTEARKVLQTTTDTTAVAPSSAAAPTVMVNAVITVSPRLNAAEYEHDFNEALVTVTCQVGCDGSWARGDFVSQHLLELREEIALSKFFHIAHLEVPRRYADATLSSAKSKSTVYDRPAPMDLDPETVSTASASNPDLIISHVPPYNVASSMSAIVFADSDLVDLSSLRSLPPNALHMLKALDEAPATTRVGVYKDDIVVAYNKGQQVGGLSEAQGKAMDDTSVSRRRFNLRHTLLTPPKSPGTPLFSGKSPGGKEVVFSPELTEGQQSLQSSSPRHRVLGKASESVSVPALIQPDTSSGVELEWKATGRKLKNTTRSSAINTEASSMRARIATKEYAVQRMEREVLRKEKQHGLAFAEQGPVHVRGRSLSHEAPSPVTVEKQTWITPLPQQHEELSAMKEEYLALTGVPYDGSVSESQKSSRVRRFFRALRRRRSQGADAIATDESSGVRPAGSVYYTQTNKSTNDHLALLAMLEASPPPAITCLHELESIRRYQVVRAAAQIADAPPLFWLLPTRTLRCDID